MSDFKIPSFISSYFSELPHEEKKEAVLRYKSWYQHDFTQMLIEDIEKKIAVLVREDENKSDFLSRFQFSYVSARNKAKRSLYRDLLAKMNWKP